MFNIGQLVRVTGVFAESFPNVYTILEIINSDDGTTAYILDQGAGGFDVSNLEAA